MLFVHTLAFAQKMDQDDPLAQFRERFYIPAQQRDQGKIEQVYLCGNSLGLQPKSAKTYLDQELKDWAELGVEGHFHGKNPWMYYHHFLQEKAAKVVGAKKEEVVIMNNLTANLHLMMVSFYQPTPKRYKILMEASAFPSDQYAMESQARFHGFDPEKAIIELHPREGEFTLRTEDILHTIVEHQEELSIVMMGGVNYYTGQAFNMKAIAAAAHQAGAVCGFDLAHAAGNLKLQLHDWDIDFAVWCTYKYLNSGPGGTSGVFVHEKHGDKPELNRFAGWWGHDESTRFKMKKGFIPMKGAAGWQLSNAQVFPMALHLASLDIFEEAGMDRLRAKSELLTAYLADVLNQFSAQITVITPAEPNERGCQLSVIVKEDGRKLFDYLSQEGILPDWREPDVIRMSPVPLYNSFTDIYKIGSALKNYFNQ